MDPKQFPAGTRDIVGGRRGFSLCLSLFGLLAGLLQSSRAQDVGRSADQEWAELKAEATAEPKARSQLPPGADAAARTQAREQRIGDYVRQADQLREFRRKNPDHVEATEAKRLEALALLKAASLGDDQNDARLEELVLAIRGDATLDSLDRLPVAAGYDTLQIRQQTGLSRDALLDAHDRVVRGLIGEFPDVPDLYESLFNLAYLRSKESAAEAAREVLPSIAHEGVKQRARMLLYRHGLVGRNLFELLAEAGTEIPAELSALRGKPLVIYAWSLRHAASVTLAKRIAAELPPQIGVLGINGDEDPAAARLLAAAERLPGSQYYATEGPASPTIRVLGIDQWPLLYTVDPSGTIIEVEAHRDPAGAIANILAP